jgi:dCMP deaminase
MLVFNGKNISMSNARSGHKKRDVDNQGHLFIQIPAHVDTWDEYFLNIAVAASIKSKDPRCPVGAVIVSKNKLLLSSGFNGLARGFHDDVQILNDAEEKLRLICHAEYNAIINAARIGGSSLEGTTIYVTKFPCFACCNAIVQAGIQRIYTHDHEFWKDDPVDQDHSRKKRLLHEAHIEVDAPYHPDFMPSKRITVPKKPSSGQIIGPTAEKRSESK